MKNGITTRAFSGLSTEQTADKMRDAGFTSCELCFVQSDLNGWAYNGRTDISEITPEKVAAAADIYRSRGVEVVSLGVFTDLRNPDEAEGEEFIKYFTRHMDFAEAANIKILASECGFTAGRRGINTDSFAEDFDRIKKNIARICAEADKRGLVIALEACVLDIVPSPKRLRDLMSQLEKEYGITNFKSLLDPANFIANADEDDMFKYLSGKIAYFHGKDRHVNDTYGCNVGEGEINWVRFFENYKCFEPDTPFIFEYCNADNCAEVKARADKFYDWAILDD